MIDAKLKLSYSSALPTASCERRSTLAAMWAIQIDEQGGPEVMQWRELPDPTPGAGEVLVELAAAGLNYIDTYHRSGLYKVALPYTLGLEGAGTVLVGRRGRPRCRCRRSGGVGDRAGLVRRAGRRAGRER